MSAVGFDKARNRAVVYTGSSCNNLCGRWRFPLLERVHGEWKEVPGVTCVEVSFSDPTPSRFSSECAKKDTSRRRPRSIL